MATRSLVYVAALVSAPALAGLVFAACGGGDSSKTDGTGGETAGPGGPASSGANTGGATSSASSSSAEGGTGGASMGCTEDGDCTIDPAKPKCEQTSGNCVGCLPADDTCEVGQYCDPGTFECTVGCTDDGDCMGLKCNTQTHKCVGCVIDTDCPQGSICVSDTCVPGCSPSQPCQAGTTCCGQSCFDLAIDVDHCGSCNEVCVVPPNAAAICVNGQCGQGMCTAPYADCDGSSITGCEHNTLQDGPCTCVAGDTQPCYQGALGTENVGVCHGGTQTCNDDGLGWGACENQVLPSSDVCANGIDEDCDSILDNGPDQDNDGWSICEGDCNDNDKLINPGAFEFIGNMVDDDCDLATSDTVPVGDCSTVQKFAAVTGDDVAKAMDLCQIATQNPPKALRKWGVLSTTQLLANGSAPSATQLANMQGSQTAVLQNFGTGGILPTKGATMAGISSGKMRDKNDVGYVIPVTGSSFGVTSQPPAPYLAAHGGMLPSSSGCSGSCPAGSGANDPVNIKLTIRVPSNAQSFSYSFRFFSGEYWSFQCTAFNDFYLALLQTAAMGLPADKNISFDGLGNPVSVNNGFFDLCPVKGCNTCPGGTAPLVGTGMDDVQGGGTNWLTTDAPIVGGEDMVLELMVFDVTDTIYDSSILLDKFVWNLSPASVGTHE